MKYLFFLFSIFLIFACSEAGTGNSEHKTCSDNSGCENSQVCFYGKCFDKGDKAMGIKTLQIVGGASLNLIDGDTTSLKVQVILSGTNEMKEVFSEDDLRKIVGPIEGETVNFKFNSQGLESTLSQTQTVTNEYGMGIINLNAKNTGSSEIRFNVAAFTEGCKPSEKCYKNFMIKVAKRSKNLAILSQNPLTFYTNSHRTVIAKLSTNNNLPYPDQDVTFKITGNQQSALLEDSSENTGTEFTVKTDFAGVARITLNSGEHPETFNLIVSSKGSQDKIIPVTIKERIGGGCTSNEDCESFGDAYECKLGACVYVPIPCSTDADCPEKFECKEGYCVEKPYVCGEDGTDLATCRCTTDLNCPETYQCVRGRCVEQDIPCQQNLDCPNGLICREGTCQPANTECKLDINCHQFKPDMCPDESSCICREGLCVNPCPDTEFIELSGGSGQNCTTDEDCGENEVCFTANNINKCIVKWKANYYFHLIDALPPSLQGILNGLGRLLGPISDILLGEDIDWGLPNWLSWLEETIVEAVRPLIDQYIPEWAQDLIIGLNDTIEILQEMKVRVKMAFIHDREHHSSIQGIESWDGFFVQWHGQWTEVQPQGEEEGFQLNSAAFTGSIACQMENGNPVYLLYIDEHPAEFYFGRFVTAFLNGVLIPAVTHDQAHNLGEAVELYVDCREVSEAMVDTAVNIVGDWASDIITVEAMEGICHFAVNKLVQKVNEQINKLHIGDTQGGSDAFKFGGFAKIETRNTEGKKLIDGKYTGTLNLGGEREFSADWDAKKSR